MFWKAEYVGNLIFGPVIISMMLLYLASVSLEPPQCLLHQRAVLKPPQAAYLYYYIIITYALCHVEHGTLWYVYTMPRHGQLND